MRLSNDVRPKKNASPRRLLLRLLLRRKRLEQRRRKLVLLQRRNARQRNAGRLRSQLVLRLSHTRLLQHHRCHRVTSRVRFGLTRPLRHWM